MDISGVSTSIASTSGAPQGESVAIAVQKKVMDIQEQNATAMIKAIPDPDSSLGHNVDVKV